MRLLRCQEVCSSLREELLGDRAPQFFCLAGLALGLSDELREEFAYSQAPKRMKSVIMGFWLLNVTLGDLLVVFVTRLKFESQVDFFWVFAGLMLIAGLIFGLRARFYKYQDFTQ